MITRTKTKSGLDGWRAMLRDNYDGSFCSFVGWDQDYGIASRLGFKSAREAWEANPLIEGSVNPSDLRVVHRRQRKATIA